MRGGTERPDRSFCPASISVLLCHCTSGRPRPQRLPESGPHAQGSQASEDAIQAARRWSRKPARDNSHWSRRPSLAVHGTRPPWQQETGFSNLPVPQVTEARITVGGLHANTETLDPNAQTSLYFSRDALNSWQAVCLDVCWYESHPSKRCPQSEGITEWLKHSDRTCACRAHQWLARESSGTLWGPHLKAAGDLFSIAPPRQVICWFPP